jgi:hypothetical protein
VRLTVVRANGELTLSQSAGIAWALRASGYRPELIPRFAFELGPMYEPGSQPTASATVTVGKTRISVHVHRPPRRPGPASPPASAPAQQNSAQGLPVQPDEANGKAAAAPITDWR